MENFHGHLSQLVRDTARFESFTSPRFSSSSAMSFILLTELYFCLKIRSTKKVGLDLSVISFVPPTTFSLLAVCPFMQWAAVRTQLSAMRAPPQKWLGFEVIRLLL